MTQMLEKKAGGLLALLVVLAIALAVTACGSSSTTQAPGSSATPGGQASADSGDGNGDGNGDGLSSGLAANLDSLDSYRFSYKYVAGSGSWDEAMTISGVVVNKPVKSAQVDVMGASTIVIGDQAWVGFGDMWVPSEDTTFDDLVDIAGDYSSWFDKDIAEWNVTGSENKNGVDCIHFKGSEQLALGYGVAGVSDFTADLWIAKDGNYPVSGVFSFNYSSGGNSGTYGMMLDITNVNDPANKVEPPKGLG